MHARVTPKAYEIIISVHGMPDLMGDCNYYR